MAPDTPSRLGTEGVLIRKIRDRFFNPLIPLGIGDDAAIVKIPQNHSIVYCSDLVAENVHFLRDLHPPDSIGYRAVAVNVSDVGAMGGVPLYFTLSIALPTDVGSPWFDGFLDGIDRACRNFKVVLAGGDSSSGDRIFVDVSMIGCVPDGREVRRSGAKSGDSIYVTGMLGGSALGLERLRSGVGLSDKAVQRHLYPSPPHVVGAALAPRVHAMIDISDGLSTDLTHILEESQVSARLYKNLIPGATGATDEHIMHGGEEYELLIIAAEPLPDTVENVALTRIGEIIPSAIDHQIFMIDRSRETVLQPRGFEHFR